MDKDHLRIYSMIESVVGKWLLFLSRGMKFFKSCSLGKFHEKKEMEGEI